jgi:hypothetical protein
MPRAASVARAWARARGPPNAASTTYRRTQYGDPIKSSARRSGSESVNEAWRAGFAVANSSPAGLRSQTPISHTASMPAGVTSSQAGSGTSASVSCRPAARDRSPSQTAVLIS